jgi:hypothetical protein
MSGDESADDVFAAIPGELRWIEGHPVAPGTKRDYRKEKPLCIIASQNFTGIVDPYPRPIQTPDDDDLEKFRADPLALKRELKVLYRELAQFYKLFRYYDAKIEAAGFANCPEGYIWRPLHSTPPLLFHADVIKPNYPFRHIVNANDALDRRLAPTRNGRRVKKITRVVEIGLQMLRDEPAGTSVRDVAEKLAPKHDYTAHYLETQMGLALGELKKGG